MPASSPLGKSIIKDWFSKQNKIKSIVDVGAGEGTYRKLLGGDYRWTAYEVWEPYIHRFDLRLAYDEVVNADIRDISPNPADCIIFGDILEHMPKADVKKVLKMAFDRFPHVVISIPVGVYEQDEIEGNPFEKHQSTWDMLEIEMLAKWRIKKLVPYCDTCPKDMGIGIFIK